MRFLAVIGLIAIVRGECCNEEFSARSDVRWKFRLIDGLLTNFIGADESCAF